jgi:hypothetical protein
MARQLDQLVRGNAVLFVGVMRMGANRAIDIVEPLGDCEQFAEPPDPRRDRDHASDASLCCPRHDPFEIIGEVRKVQMAMAVDQHDKRAQAAVGSM